MKICVIFSSYDGAGSSFQDFDEYQDPTRYNLPSYEFTIVFVKKETAIKELDALVGSGRGYDLYWNFMWGQERDLVAGVEAVDHLHTLGVPLLGPTPKFLKMGKLDFKKSGARAGLLTPKWTSDPNAVSFFPVIIKPSHGCGSLFMSQASLCQNAEELQVQMELLKGCAYSGEIIIEEFIPGKEVSVMVFETRDGLMALSPIQYDLGDEEFLHFDKKFGQPNYKILRNDSPLSEKIKEAGITAFDCLGVRGSSYARVDFRVSKEGSLYLLEVNQVPAFFSPPGNKYGDDEIISETFPGGHKALLDLIISTKMGLGLSDKIYTRIAPSYNIGYLELDTCQYTKILANIVNTFNFSGSILDLGCGTGVFGKLIKDRFPDSKLTGIDGCRAMAQLVEGTTYSKVIIGLVENCVMEFRPLSFDHIISSAFLHHLDPLRFKRVLKTISQLAKKSLTFTIENIPDTYIKQLEAKGEGDFPNFNHLGGFLKQFPKDWRIVHLEKRFLWKSLNTDVAMDGLVVRMERT